jgi:endo-1,4-beta-mannosidase
MATKPFILGVNYWPRRKAMAWWSDFDPGEVREEFALIRELGLGWVRIFLLWEDWQPSPAQVDPQALQHLEQVCDTAAALGLQLDVTFFVGHMSGPSWVPGWLRGQDLAVPPGVRQVVCRQTPVAGGYLNPFHDAVAVQAAEHLLRTVVARFRDHPALGVWNLGNEPDLFARPHSAAAGRAWVRRMARVIYERDPHHPVTCGLHTPSLLEDNGLRVHDVFAELDLAVMHGYPMYCDWAASPLDPDFVPFLCALTSALCGKPVLMEEFGGCTAPPGAPGQVWEWTSYGQTRRQYMAAEEDLAAHLEQVLAGLLDVGALGAMLWCYADYAPELYQRPPCDEAWHERFFGLVRPDGTLKPHAAVLRRFAAAQHVVRPARHRVVLDMTPEDFYQAPLGHAQRLYQAFRAEGGSTA